MLLVGSEPHHIARSDFLDRAAIALNPTETRHDDQGLAERMGVPCRACARLKGDQRAGYAGRIGWTEQRIDPHRPRKPLRPPFARWLCATSFDLHRQSL